MDQKKLETNLPRAPLRFMGAISDRYMGTKCVFKPQLIPMKNLPMIKHSNDLNNCELDMRVAPRIAIELFRSNPHFLPHQSAMNPPLYPPNIPPMANIDTVMDQIKSSKSADI